MIYLLVGYLAFSLMMMYTVLQKNQLLGWWGIQMGVLLAVAILVMSIVFLVAKKIRRYDLVDAGWAWAAMAVVLASLFMQRRIDHLWDINAQLLVAALVCIWGVRLSSHIVRRIRHTTQEDQRYVELRKSWKGHVATNTFVRIYMLQAVLILLITMPATHTELFFNFQPHPMSSLIVVAGLGIWLFGFVFEMIADRQLRSFIANSKNKGKIMDRGLWSYSRHPNYFGELLQWWGMYVICLSVPVGWLFGLVGPVLLTYLIFFVSGIPATERRFEGRKGWAEYKASTSAIIPLPHRQ